MIFSHKALGWVNPLQVSSLCKKFAITGNGLALYDEQPNIVPIQNYWHHGHRIEKDSKGVPRPILIPPFDSDWGTCEILPENNQLCRIQIGIYSTEMWASIVLKSDMISIKLKDIHADEAYKLMAQLRKQIDVYPKPENQLLILITDESIVELEFIDT